MGTWNGTSECVRRASSTPSSTRSMESAVRCVWTTLPWTLATMCSVSVVWRRTRSSWVHLQASELHCVVGFHRDQRNRSPQQSIPLLVVQAYRGGRSLRSGADWLRQQGARSHRKGVRRSASCLGSESIYENGIAYREFYHHTNKEEECMINKYHISGYE